VQSSVLVEYLFHKENVINKVTQCIYIAFVDFSNGHEDYTSSLLRGLCEKVFPVVRLCFE